MYVIKSNSGAGKTTKMKELLSIVDQSKCAIMTFKTFKSSIKSDLKEKFDVIAIDKIPSVEQMKYLSAAICTENFILIVTTQMSVNELETAVLSNFDVVECGAWRYPTSLELGQDMNELFPNN